MAKGGGLASRIKVLTVSVQEVSSTYPAPDGSRPRDTEKQGGPDGTQHTTNLPRKEAEDGVEPIALVTWDGPDDPANPIKWSTSLKITNIGIVSALTFLTPLASSMLAPGIPLIESEFHNHNEELSGFVLSVYILGFAIGPMVLAPMSELYGKSSKGRTP